MFSNTVMTELDAYRQNIQRLAELESTEVFSNAQAEHAAVIMETFFKFARQGVMILCHKLSQQVYDSPELIKAAESLLSERKRIRILSQQQPEAKGFLAAAERWTAAGLPFSLTVAPSGSVASSLKTNFAVMDKKAYRFEPEAGTSPPRAYACMNNPELAESLFDLFVQLESRST